MSNLRLAVYFVIPLEVWRNGQFHSQRRPCDWLHMDRQFQLRQLVNILMDCLATLWHPDQLTNLVRIQVIEPLPRKILLLNLADDFLGDLLELAQWTHGLPPAINRHWVT